MSERVRKKEKEGKLNKIPLSMELPERYNYDLTEMASHHTLCSEMPIITEVPQGGRQSNKVFSGSGCLGGSMSSRLSKTGQTGLD